MVHAGSTDVIAALDIGTNSIHLVVAAIDDESRTEVLAREKESVRLGAGAAEMKHLEPDAIDRGIATLSRFAAIANLHHARVRAVATSAVREAENRSEFVRRAGAEAGVNIEVVSGTEEARLIHLGVLQAIPVFDQQHAVIDIGGGSTEVVVARGGDVDASRSFKLGAIRLTNRFFASEHLHPGSVEACRRYVAATVAPFADQVRALGFETLVGSSGTIGALGAVATALDSGSQPQSRRGMVLTRSQLDTVVTRLVSARTVAERAAVPGVAPSRADIILGGSLILEQLLDALGARELVFSDYALREGVLFDTWRRLHGRSLHHLSDIRRRSVLHLQRLSDEDPVHSARVAELALQLFDGTLGLHSSGDDARELLEAAALLANVGLGVAHSAHHKHSYYLIRHSEHLTGFTDREIELIAVVARYHRKSAPRQKHPEFAALGSDDQGVVRVLAGLLRIAVGLDRRRGGRVRSVSCRLVDDGGERQLVIDAEPGTDASIDLELYEANERCSLLASTLGIAVRVRSTRSIPSAP
ncbi:MAG TPA: Ppx/GppA phosphatase family protein [Acidimicrobiales bacterium]